MDEKNCKIFSVEKPIIRRANLILIQSTLCNQNNNCNFRIGFGVEQGCQVVYFQTKNRNLGKILEVLGMKKVCIFIGHLEYITSIWYILSQFGNLVAIWYISHRFGILNKEKSGNPAVERKRCR
jgi:hypothetical protein